MKQGDLVQLSAYGSSRSFNVMIKTKNPVQTGLIISINNKSAYPFTVFWFVGNPGGHKRHTHARKELKYAKKIKGEGKLK